MYRVVAVGVVHHPAVSQQLRSLGRTFGVLHRLDDSHQRNIAARGTAAEPHTRQQHARHSSNRICLIIQSHKALNAGGKKGKGSPYSITERRVPQLIPVLGTQPAGDVNHKPDGRLPLLSARPAVTPAPKRAATNFATR